MNLTKLRQSPDFWAVVTLVVVWVFFFWRIWTPIQADQVSFAEGDFSAQFVTWTDYAVEHLKAGEIPLWNPYQYGGAPFQASSQTALTYPPRMLTLALLLMQSDAQPWEVYAALQREVLLHVLLASLFVYVFVRRLIGENAKLASPVEMGSRLKPSARPQSYAAFGGLAAALTYAYGGYAAGYPILQIPVLEAGIWLPLVLLGILEATRPENSKMGWACLVFSGTILGLSLLAGHPQTASFTIYMAAAWLGYRVWLRRWSWRVWLMGILLIGILGGLLAAVQLIPTAEFSAHTARVDFSFEDKGGGYSFEEISNVLFPIRGSIWNASHFGIVTLVLAGVAIGRRARGWGFFAGMFGAALLLSFGMRTPVYGILYPILPGLYLFRGQERATFIMAHCFAVLVGMGAAHLLTWSSWRERSNAQTLRRGILALLSVSLIYTLVMYVLAQTDSRSESIIARMESGALTTMILFALLLFLNWFMRDPAAHTRTMALAGVLIFDLFSVTFMLRQNYESIPVTNRLPTPDYAQTMREPLLPGDRVDGTAAYEPGYGTLYRLPDVNGSDPLQLEAMRFYPESLEPSRRWELLNVRVVALDPEADVPVPATLLSHEANFNLWEIDNPRGFARPVYLVTLVNNDDEARGLVREPAFDLRRVVILESMPEGMQPAADFEAAEQLEDEVYYERFEPEHIDLLVVVPRPAILTLSLPHFPGWRAEVDDAEVEILRAYGGVSAVFVPEGLHFVKISYDSRRIRAAGLVSAILWSGVGLFTLIRFMPKTPEKRT